MKCNIYGIAVWYEEYFDAPKANYLYPANLEMEYKSYSVEKVLNHIKKHLKKENALINFMFSLSVVDESDNLVKLEFLSYNHDLSLLEKTTYDPITREPIIDYNDLA